MSFHELRQHDIRSPHENPAVISAQPKALL